MPFYSKILLFGGHGSLSEHGLMSRLPLKVCGGGFDATRFKPTKAAPTMISNGLIGPAVRSEPIVSHAGE